ncbi:MAG: 30S ribosomal protein S6 [Desulfobulbaceae bacterium]|nr:30S ribosomal protein S6 [Desulfobulbaceae bacterium]
MRRYETIFIIRPNAGEDDITEIIDRNTGIIVDDFGGTMLTIDKWGIKKLAYLIKKEQQGYYVYIQYAGVPEAVTEMERLLKIDDRVLKYMTIKLQEQFAPDPEFDKADDEEEADAAEDSEDSETSGDSGEADDATPDTDDE